MEGGPCDLGRRVGPGLSCWRTKWNHCLFHRSFRDNSGDQAAGVSSPIIFSQRKKQMVNSTGKKTFLELILIKDMWAALAESRGTRAGCGGDEGRRRHGVGPS